MDERLKENATAEEILHNSFVERYLKEIFSLDTFGPLQMFPASTAEEVLKSFLKKGRKEDIIYGINGSMEALREGRLRVERLPGQHRTVVAFVYLAKQENAPTAFVLPGGAYATCATLIEGIPIAVRLTELGCNAVVVKYATGLKARHPGPIEDVAQVYHYLESSESYRKMNLANYSLWGFSAGGHLAGCMGKRSVLESFGLPAPTALVFGYPVVSFEQYAHKMSKRLFLGAFHNRQDKQEWGLEYMLDKDCPPVFDFHCSGDSVVNVENSRLLHRHLEEMGVRHEFVEFPGGNHGYGLACGTVAQGWVERAVQFWKECA